MHVYSVHSIKHGNLSSRTKKEVRAFKDFMYTFYMYAIKNLVKFGKYTSLSDSSNGS